MRHQPRVEARILLLAAEAVVARRAVELLVRVTALGTATPHGMIVLEARSVRESPRTVMVAIIEGKSQMYMEVESRL